MDRDNLWKKQISEKSGKIYFVNTITGELFETSTSIHEKDSYIKIQTIDGQVQIPEDALVVLIQWSSIFDVFSRWKKDSIPNVNVSSSYLTRLISIACASFQYDSIDKPLDDEDSMLLYHSIDDPLLLKFKLRKQIYYMFNLHTKDPFTSFYDKEIGITDQMNEFFNELTGYNEFCEHNRKDKSDKILISDTAFGLFCYENTEKVIERSGEWKKVSDNDGRYYNTITGFVHPGMPDLAELSDKLKDELTKMWVILKKSTNEEDKKYVSDLEDREKKILIEKKEHDERIIIRELKSLWKNLDENERLEWCLHEMVNAGLDIN